MAKPAGKSRPSFPRERRFLEYTVLSEKRSNAILGPGTYNGPSVVSALRNELCLVSYVSFSQSLTRSLEADSPRQVARCRLHDDREPDRLRAQASSEGGGSHQV